MALDKYSIEELVLAIEQNNENNIYINELRNRYERYFNHRANKSWNNFSNSHSAEDIASIAFFKLIKKIKKGKATNKNELKGLIKKIVKRTSKDEKKKINRKKRGGTDRIVNGEKIRVNKVVGETVFMNKNHDKSGNRQGGIDDFPEDTRPVHDKAFNNEVDELVSELAKKNNMEEIWKLHNEDWNNREIAEKVGLAESTVSNKIILFKNLLEERNRNLDD